MLIDRSIVEVRSGKGGDGAISFLQDKNTQRGGPDGGNGGKGGSVYFRATSNLNTLYNFRHSKTFIAPDGGKGGKTLKHGKDAPDLYIEVPLGTVVTEEKTGRVIADLAEDGEVALIAKGGRGGRGNATFKSSRHRIPRIAQNGHPGERFRLVLELKMLCDAALIGFPSVGKSSLLNIATAAYSEVASYPFTTLEPKLGVVRLADGRRFVLGDMPGLIAGASAGKGLGTRFLRHIERSRVLIHVLAMDGSHYPYEAYIAIRKELAAYDPNLLKRPEIVVANMMDLEGAAERKAELDGKLGFISLPLSTFSREGLKGILIAAMKTLETAPTFPLKGLAPETDFKVYDAHEDPDAKPHVVKDGPRRWRLLGAELLRKAALINTREEEGLEQFVALLDRNGVEKLLEEAGALDGDVLAVLDQEFVYGKEGTHGG